jgi:hypothetical protein
VWCSGTRTITPNLTELLSLNSLLLRLHETMGVSPIVLHRNSPRHPLRFHPLLCQELLPDEPADVSTSPGSNGAARRTPGGPRARGVRETRAQRCERARVHAKMPGGRQSFACVCSARCARRQHLAEFSPAFAAEPLGNVLLADRAQLVTQRRVVRFNLKPQNLRS